jgi:hypothetical protein
MRQVKQVSALWYRGVGFVNHSAGPS